MSGADEQCQCENGSADENSQCTRVHAEASFKWASALRNFLLGIELSDRIITDLSRRTQKRKARDAELVRSRAAQHPRPWRFAARFPRARFTDPSPQSRAGSPLRLWRPAYIRHKYREL